MEMKPSLMALAREIELDLGTLREGAEPLLHEVSKYVDAIEPGPAGVQLGPKDRDVCMGKLAKALERLEDLLEALQVAAHNGGSNTREGPQ
jgi:hypothetical protein